MLSCLDSCRDVSSFDLRWRRKKAWPLRHLRVVVSISCECWHLSSVLVWPWCKVEVCSVYADFFSLPKCNRPTNLHLVGCVYVTCHDHVSLLWLCKHFSHTHLLFFFLLHFVFDHLGVFGRTQHSRSEFTPFYWSSLGWAAVAQGIANYGFHVCMFNEHVNCNCIQVNSVNAWLTNTGIPWLIAMPRIGFLLLKNRRRHLQIWNLKLFSTRFTGFGEGCGENAILALN